MGTPIEKPMMELFARHMAKGCTATEAYRLAGYKPSPAMASKMGKNPIIRARIEEIMNERERLLEVPTVSILEPHDREDSDKTDRYGIGFEEVTGTWVIERLASNVLAAQHTGQFAAANKALEMLGQYLGLSFADKSRPDAPNGGTLGSGNTINILQLTEALSVRGTHLENDKGQGAKDITPKESDDT